MSRDASSVCTVKCFRPISDVLLIVPVRCPHAKGDEKAGLETNLQPRFSAVRNADNPEG